MELYLKKLIELTDLTQDRPLKEIVYEGLRKAIILGVIPVGERINQKNYALYMNISRTPIRSGIEMLKAEGLLEEIPGYGVVVKKITEEDVEEIFKIRTSLETLASIEAMEIMTPAEHQQMDDLLAATIAANEAGDSEAVVAYFSDYNHLLLSFARMPRLVLVVEQLREYLIRFRDISLHEYERRTRALFEHTLIYHCIKTKDKELVKIVIKDHLNVAKEYIIAEIKARDKIIAIEHPELLEKEYADDDL